MQIIPDQPTIPNDAFPVPGPLYPDRCLACPEILRESYGCGQYAHCAVCAAVDRSKPDIPGAMP